MLSSRVWKPRITAFEAIEKTAEAGGKLIEFFPDQKLSKEEPGVKWGHDASDEVVAKVKGVTATADQATSTVTISSSSKAALQQTVDALVTAGYYGKSSDSSIKVAANTGAQDGKVQSLKVEGVHLCCGKCVTAVQGALGKVPGVKANTAEKNVKSFEVTGDFSAKAVFDALNEAGLTGKVAK